MRLIWFKRPKGGARELIYKGQHFWRWGGNIHYKRPEELIRRRSPNTYIGDWYGRCVRCGFCGETAIREFKPTARTRTKYTDWKKCEVGFCHRMTLLINGRPYWAKHVPEKRKVLIFNTHLGRTPIGSLNETVLPIELRSKIEKKA